MFDRHVGRTVAGMPDDLHDRVLGLDLLPTGLHVMIDHLASEYSIMGKRITSNIRGAAITSAWKQNGEMRYRIADDHSGAQPRPPIKKRIVVDGFIETENHSSAIHIHPFKIDASDITKAAHSPDSQYLSTMNRGGDTGSRQ